MVQTQILVVDNGSTDATVARIRRDYPTVEIVENGSNKGFGQANNIGFEKAIKENYDYVFLVNQDAWVEPDCLERLMAALHDDRVAIVSPLHYDGEGKELDRGFAVYYEKAVDRGTYSVVPYVNAAFWLMPVRILKSIGSFSPIFYHYGEDTDYVNRLAFHGFEIRVVKDAVAYHDRQYRQLTEDQFFRGEFVYLLTEYCNINYGAFKGVIMSLGALFKKVIRCLLQGRFRYAKRYLRLTIPLLLKSSEVFATKKRNRVLCEKGGIN